MLLHKKVAVVTGASRGIGKATLLRLAEEGATVIGIYQHRDDLAIAIEDQLRGMGCPGEFIKGSIREQQFVQSVMKHTAEKYGAIDIVVNNAGIARDNLTMMMTEEQWSTVFETNFQGTFHCCHEALPWMSRQKSGCIVNVVSVSSVHGRAGQSNYAASKGAIIGLTRMLARKYSADNIRINAIAPGMIETEMLKDIQADKLEQFLKFTHVQRPGTAEEIAEHIVYLSSPISSYLSGTVLQVDGGFLR